MARTATTTLPKDASQDLKAPDTATTTLPNDASEDLKAQVGYSDQKEQEGGELDLMVADAFVRGIRDIGYKSTGTALNELIDNAIQAEARSVHVLAVFAKQDTGKRGKPKHSPLYLAVIDDGHGMPPKMLRHAIRWGGTHRENDRTGFGRFGYGLPSASVSQGRRFTVLSSMADADWHGAGLDIDLVGDGTYNREGRIVIPKETRKGLPDDIRKYMAEQIGAGNLSKDALERGTVLIIDKLDEERLESTVPETLENHLLETFGVTYRNYLRAVKILVNGKKVEAIDPLFTTPGLRLYDYDILDKGEKVKAPVAVKYDEMTAEVKEDLSGMVGKITIRVSRLPSTFANTNLVKNADGEWVEAGKPRASMKSARLKIMHNYAGLVVCRKGRQIDVVRALPRDWHFKVGNDARYVRVEIDFPPELDRYFSVTTSKQQIVLKQKLWDVLSELDLKTTLSTIVKDYIEDRANVKKKWEDRARTEPLTPRPSELAVQEGDSFNPRPRPPLTNDQKHEDQQNWSAIVRAEADKTGRPVAEVEGDLKVRVTNRHYEIKEETVPGGPFYRPVRVGPAVWVYLNTEHRFYKELYRGPNSTPRLRWALEVMLIVLGSSETTVTDEMLIEFYKKERGLWSTRLDTDLNLLNRHAPVEDEREAAEAAEDAQAEAEEQEAVAAQ
jgi:hypothetical protein